MNGKRISTGSPNSGTEVIAKRILGREATREEAPIILDEYGGQAGIDVAKHNIGHRGTDLRDWPVRI